MSRHARLLFTSVIAAGSISFCLSLYPFVSQYPVRYAAFLLAAILSCGMRVSLPSINGTHSINFVFVLIGVIALSRAETMVLATVVTFIQCVWKPPRKPTALQVAFDVSNMATAVFATYTVYRSWTFSDPSIDIPLRLLLATSVYYVLNGFPVALAISFTQRKSIAAAWRECNTWSLPYYLVGAIAAAAFGFLKTAAGWQMLLMLLPFIFLIYRHYRLYLTRLEEEKRHADELADLQLRTIEALALAIEAKDHNSHNHLNRIQTFALGMAEEIGLPGPEMAALHAASLLHDIGKLAVPENIISKPGKLTREEFEKMKIHPLVGAEILERVKFPYPVVPIVRHHHEKYNGGGYPDGLSGEQIPIGARILSVANEFEMLTARGSFKLPLSPQEAVEAISSEAGIAFDPRVVTALEKSYRELERRADERISSRAKLTTYQGQPVDAKAKPIPPSEERTTNFLVSIAGARQEAHALFELAQELGSSLSLDETLSVFAVRLRKTVPYDAIAIYVRRDNILRPEYVSGENVRVFSTMEIPIGAGLSGWVMENRKPIVNGNPLMEPGYKEEPGRSTPLRAALSIPLEGAGGVAGVLTLYRTDKDGFTRDHLRVLQAISGKVAISIENALKYRQAESSAATDYLTGLLNARSLFLHLDSELARCRRMEAPLAVLVSDLDGFKMVNDRFGHLEGNKLLQQVARRLKDSCREYDCVARMGGDEFVMVLPGLAPEAVKKLIPRLRETVKQAGKDVLNQDVIGFSVGEAYFPTDGVDAEQLLAEADKRMYQFKGKMKMLRTGGGYDFDVKEVTS